VLHDEVQSGAFRDDLYYRLNIVNIKLPPLRDRKEDIPILVKHFVRRFNLIRDREIEGVSDTVMNILMEYDYPGNIRELENIIEHAFVLCKEPYVQVQHLPAHLRHSSIDTGKPVTLEELEKSYIKKALEKNEWNRTKTADELGIDKSTLWRKIKKYQIH